MKKHKTHEMDVSEEVIPLRSQLSIPCCKKQCLNLDSIQVQLLSAKPYNKQTTSAGALSSSSVDPRSEFG